MAGTGGFDSFTNQGQAVPAKKEQLLQRPLGRTGLKVPIVGMGVMNARDPEVIKQSIHRGVRLFDTAKAYGNGENERLLGLAIKDLGVRQKVIIQTKVLHPVGHGMGRSPEPLPEKTVTAKCIREVEQSLQRLQTDAIDILYYHAVDNPGMLKGTGMREALLRLKREGKVRYLGVSTHSHQRVLPGMLEEGIYDALMVQLNITMADDHQYLGSIRKAAEAGLGVIAMKTQGGNRLAPGIMNHGAALKWVLRQKWVTAAVPGYTDLKQMKENAGVGVDLEYAPAERKFLQARTLLLSMNFCRRCGLCLGDCPMNTDIPSLMAVHMYTYGYGNVQQARELWDTIPAGAGLSNCIACSACRARCRNHADIPGNIAQLKDRR